MTINELRTRFKVYLKTIRARLAALQTTETRVKYFGQSLGEKWTLCDKASSKRMTDPVYNGDVNRQSRYLWTWVPFFRSIAFIHILCVRGDLYQHIQTDAAATKRAARVRRWRLDHILYTPPAEHVSAVGYYWDREWIQANRTLLIRSWTQKGDKGRYKLLTEFFWSRTALKRCDTKIELWIKNST